MGMEVEHVGVQRSCEAENGVSLRSARWVGLKVDGLGGRAGWLRDSWGIGGWCVMLWRGRCCISRLPLVVSPSQEDLSEEFHNACPIQWVALVDVAPEGSEADLFRGRGVDLSELGEVSVKFVQVRRCPLRVLFPATERGCGRNGRARGGVGWHMGRGRRAGFGWRWSRGAFSLGPIPFRTRRRDEPSAVVVLR